MTAGSSIARRWMVIGLGLVLVSSVLSGWSDDPWASSLVETEVFLLVMALAMQMLFGHLRSRFKWILVPSLLAAFWPVLQNLFGFSVYPFVTWMAALTWATYAGVLWLALQSFAWEGVGQYFRSAAVIFAVGIAIQAMLQKLTFNGKLFWMIRTHVTPKAMGPFLNYDHYSTFVELLLPIALWTGWKDRTHRFAWLGAAAILYGSVIASTSRAGSALVTLETLALVGAALLGPERRRALRFGILALSLLALAGFAADWGALLDRFGYNDLFAGRREIWPVALTMARVHPWTGFGLGTWPTVYPAYANWDAVSFVNHATSDWLEWVDDGGFIFAGLVALIAGRGIWLCRRSPWAIGIISAFVHCAVDYPFQRPTLMLWLVALLGCAEAEAENALRHPRRPHESRPHESRID